MDACFFIYDCYVLLHLFAKYTYNHYSYPLLRSYCTFLYLTFLLLLLSPPACSSISSLHMTSYKTSKRHTPKVGDVFVGNSRLYRDARECQGLYIVTGMAEVENLIEVYLQPIESQEVKESKRYTKRGWFKTSVEKKAVTPIVYLKTQRVQDRFYLEDYKNGKAFQRGFGHITFTLIEPDQNGDYPFTSEIIDVVTHQKNDPYEYGIYAPVFSLRDKEDKKKNRSSSFTFFAIFKTSVKKWLNF